MVIFSSQDVRNRSCISFDRPLAVAINVCLLAFACFMSLGLVDSLASQLKLITELYTRLVNSAPSTQYGSEAMQELLTSQSNHFDVLINGLRENIVQREDRFNRALMKTQSEQSVLESEVERLEKLLKDKVVSVSVGNEVVGESTVNLTVNDSTVCMIDSPPIRRESVIEVSSPSGLEELSQLRDRLRAQIAQLESFSL